MRKLLIVSDVSAPYRIEVFKRLSEAFDVTVFFNRSREQSRDPSWYVTSSKCFEFYVLNNTEALQKYEAALKMIAGFDAVLCYDPWAKRSRALQRLCMRKRVPYVLNADGALSINTSFIKKTVKTFYVKRAALCFAGCKRAEEYFLTYGAKKGKIVRHPFTSLSEDAILREPPTEEEKKGYKARLGIDPDANVVLAVGQFIHRKGFDLLLKAWRKTSGRAHLFIVGGGPLESEYEHQVCEDELKNAHILGFKTSDELALYYLAADVFVMPTREDIWGLVVNEAMSRAVPVISSDMCTAGLELIDDGVNGFIYHVYDTDKLAECINSVRADSPEYEKMRRKALLAVKEHTYENVASAHISAIKSILEK